ncbi:MAG: hypothetical protein H6575_09550 [Lewinellaceae bacterium]|nr:hypothetical protein [Lewinellaceae bacterium]
MTVLMATGNATAMPRGFLISGADDQCHGSNRNGRSAPVHAALLRLLFACALLFMITMGVIATAERTQPVTEKCAMNKRMIQYPGLRSRSLRLQWVLSAPTGLV